MAASEKEDELLQPKIQYGFFLSFTHLYLFRIASNALLALSSSST